jgi:hypothetical protein
LLKERFLLEEAQQSSVGVTHGYNLRLNLFAIIVLLCYIMELNSGCVGESTVLKLSESLLIWASCGRG